jgi:integrase
MHAIDPANELISVELLPSQAFRGTPHLYSQAQIDALIAAAETLRTQLRVATMQTLLGLLVVTGMRIGEVVGLDRDDFDARNGFLLIRGAKFGKSRELALHPSTVEAVQRYLRRADRPAPARETKALLLTSVGTRLGIADVQRTFVTLRRRAGIETDSTSRQPRLHDIRHSFAVSTVVDVYKSGEDPGHTLALLATYLGHVSPTSTYWYLSAAPELMQLAADRLERHVVKRS